MTVSLVEEFDARAWDDYSAYDSAVSAQLECQRHVDIRTFATDSGEAWTAGTTGAMSAFDHLPGISIACSMGTTVTTTSTTAPIDLATGFADDDLISLALPGLATGINQAASGVRFVDDDGASATISLSASVVPLVAGSDSEFCVPRDALAGIDLGSLVTVQLIVVPTANCTFVAMALRLLASTWQLGAIDFDTVGRRLVRTTPRDGDVTSVAQFANTIFWRSTQPAGAGDPRPIDSTFATLLNTGSQNGGNSLTLYVRETPRAFLTQLDLDLMTQTQLDGLDHQPDDGVSEYKGRTVEDLAGLALSRLDGSTLFDLEARVDPTYTSWIQFQLQWGSTNQATITNSATSTVYAYPNLQTTDGPITLANNHYYALITSVEDSGVRLALYDVDQSTCALLSPAVFDTLIINDDSAFPVHPGRFGWSATLVDGDASISSIRPTHLTFAEYRSAPFVSHTPVVGAQLFASYTPDREYFTPPLTPYPEAPPVALLVKDEDDVDFIVGSGPTPSPDASTLVVTSDAFGGGSTRVAIPGGGAAAYQGVMTGVLPILDLSETGVRFEVFYPRPLVAADQPLQAALLYVSDVASDPLLVPLAIPPLQGGQWEGVTINPGSGSATLPAGDWRLVIRAPTSMPSTWYVRALSVFERVVKWEARSVVDDPWSSNYAPWTPFHDLVSVSGGALFPVRGTNLQMRARALRQDAQILGRPSLVPKYGQLGRLVWPEDRLQGVVPPVYSISAIVLGRFVSLTATQVSAGTGPGGSGTAPVALFEWTLGDQTTVLGQSITHDYDRPGVYSVTLVVTDFYGNRTPVTTTITCS